MLCMHNNSFYIRHRLHEERRDGRLSDQSSLARHRADVQPAGAEVRWNHVDGFCAFEYSYRIGNSGDEDRAYDGPGGKESYPLAEVNGREGTHLSRKRQERQAFSARTAYP